MNLREPREKKKGLSLGFEHVGLYGCGEGNGTYVNSEESGQAERLALKTETNAGPIMKAESASGLYLKEC